jgi:hypothetical protein
MVSLRRRQVIIAGLAAAVVPAFFPALSWSFAAPGKLVLSGRILGADAKPLSGATVSMGTDQVAADADGRFALITTAAQPARAQYRVTHEGRAADGIVADARRDLDGTWRASFGLTLA